MTDSQRLRKIVILGNRAVGKSSLTIQFIENQFVDSYYPTIEHTFTKRLRHQGSEYTCEIVDTAGQDEFSIFPSAYGIGVHGYILVYSITSRASLEMAKIIRDKILNLVGTEWVPVVLVANKNDLHMQREVSQEEGREVAERWRCPFVETSAKHGENIERVFDLMIESIERASEGTEQTKPGSGCLVM